MAGLSVTRRYSEFVYLMSVLEARFPLRLLPALPPKRLGLNGRYLAVDDNFLASEHPFSSRERSPLLILAA